MGSFYHNILSWGIQPYLWHLVVGYQRVSPYICWFLLHPLHDPPPHGLLYHINKTNLCYTGWLVLAYHKKWSDRFVLWSTIVTFNKHIHSWSNFHFIQHLGQHIFYKNMAMYLIIGQIWMVTFLVTLFDNTCWWFQCKDWGSCLTGTLRFSEKSISIWIPSNVRVQLQSLKFQISCLFQARSSLTFRQL